MTKSERKTTKSKFCKLKIATVFASLRKHKPTGSKYAALHSILKSHSVNCLNFENNTRQADNYNFCLFRALALQFHGNEELEGETPNFSVFLSVTVRKEIRQVFTMFI